MDIIISDLSKKYGEKRVLEHLSMRIREGCITSIMSPSGSGKTTLLRILTGLEKADSGRVEGLEGKKISMVFQEDRLCENLSAAANVALVCEKGIDRKRITEELAQVGLAGSELQQVNKLSGGMRRRVALVRALMADYDVLILDEPFQGLDIGNKEAVMKYTIEKSKGKTVLLITHDEKEAQLMSHEILTITVFS